MSKIRVYELAKELGVENREFIVRLEKLGIAVKSHSSSLEIEDVERVRREFALGERNEVVEKRVKSTVIRRRAVRQPAPDVTTPDDMESEKVVEPAKEDKEINIETEKAEAPVAESPRIEEKEEQAAKEEKGAERAEPAKEDKEINIETEKAEAPVAESPRIEEKEEQAAKEEKGAERAERTEAVEAKEAAKKSEDKIKKVGEAAKESSSDKDASAKSKEAKSSKKKRRPVEIVMDDTPARGGKALLKEHIEKKSKRSDKPDVKERFKSWREEKKLSSSEMKKTEITTPKAIKRRIKIEGDIKVSDLAKKMGVKASEVIGKLVSLGMMITINQSIDVDVATIVAGDFGYQIESAGINYEELVQKADTSSTENLKPRAPVVTIMGHVDHGKTSLLDAIRKTNVIDGESGGITQAIGAYHVNINGKDIVFLDTPGHEAFTAMRARGAQATDIVVLVVAADDGVMDQTVEAINHSKAAGVPIIVAVNKIDKDGSNPDNIKQQLSEYGLVPEAWGGDVIFSEVSAKKKIGIEELLELIILQADIMELKADPDKPAHGVVIESKLDKGRGPVGTVLIQEGTLREGDAFVSKTEYGRVRAMIDDKGNRVKEAGPSTPVEVIGFSEVPQVGVDFVGVEDEKTARTIGEYWRDKKREKGLSGSPKVTLEQLYEKIKEGTKEFNVVIKGDVQGSIGALSDALLKLSTNDVKLNVIHGSTGTITETDIMLASASDAIIIGFKVRPDARTMDIAEREGVDIKLYDVIYDVISDTRAAMEGLLEPIYEEVVEGRAEVRELFKVPRVGVVAGSYVTDGKITRNSNLRLVRDGIVIYDGKLLSLKRFKDDAKEVSSGFECGIGIEGFNDIRVNDIIEAYTKNKIERKL